MPYFRLHIENPCSESWDEMSPREGGRHCAHCEKTVVDFTRLTDREISQLVSKGKKLCGRLRTDQLDRVYPMFREVARPSAPYRHMAAGFLMAALILSSQPGNAQLQSQPVADPAPIAMVDGIKRVDDIKLGQVTKDEDVKTPMYQVKGAVKGPYSPIVNVRVSIYTLDNYYEGFTDEEGKFIIEIPLSEVREKNLIEFNYDFIEPYIDTTGYKNEPDTYKGIIRESYYNSVKIESNESLKEPIIEYVRSSLKTRSVIMGLIACRDESYVPQNRYFVNGKEYSDFEVLNAKEGLVNPFGIGGVTTMREAVIPGYLAKPLIGDRVEGDLYIYYIKK